MNQLAPVIAAVVPALVGVIVDSSRKSTLSRIEELGARIS